VVLLLHLRSAGHCPPLDDTWAFLAAVLPVLQAQKRRQDRRTPKNGENPRA
jgi:hypothetical protein